LLTWKTVNLPGIKDIDLHTFWGDMPLYIVAYDLVKGPEKNEIRHLQQQKRYFFKFKLENLGEVFDDTIFPHAGLFFNID